MATKVIMPKQGLQMTEGTILKWLVGEGEKCEEGVPLFEIETDKLTISINAPATGTLLKIIRGEGETVPITELIGVIGQPGEDVSEFSRMEAVSVKEKVAKVGAFDCEVAVIGGGPGGYIAAIRSSQLGKKTLLVEDKELGGTCLNRGCIPTKALLHSSEIFATVMKASDYGVVIEGIDFDFAKMMNTKENTVKILRNGVAGLLKKYAVDVIRGRAKLTGTQSFEVEGKEYQAENIILATGSVPANIPIPGSDKSGVVNSDEVLTMDKCPRSVVIIGGGVIGVEFATLFQQLNVPVTIIEMMPNILTGMDDEICETMKAVLKKKGLTIHTDAKVLEITDGLECVFEKNGEIQSAKADSIIMAVGRKPNIEGLGLEKVGIAMRDGFIDVDERMQTNIPNVYAIGDITGKVQLAHVASAQGIVAAENVSGLKKKMRYDRIPACIYSDPEIASVGMTEGQAKIQKKEIRIGKFYTSGNGKSMIMGNKDGFVKLISDRNTGEIYGAHIMAPRATDMIGEIVVAMNAEATAEEVARSVHPHPTVSEIIGEAAQDIYGESCNK